MLEVSFRPLSPSPDIICFCCSRTPFQRTSPPRIAQHLGGVPCHQLGTVVVDAQSRCGAACASERAAVTRMATIQTDGHDKQEQQQDNAS
jgi:hypothetical protein